MEDEELSSSRKRLARIRCTHDVIKCFQENTIFPECFCYIPGKVVLKSTRKQRLLVYAKPSLNSEKVAEMLCDMFYLIAVSGDMLCNKDGQWSRILEVSSVNEQFKP